MSSIWRPFRDLSYQILCFLFLISACGCRDKGPWSTSQISSQNPRFSSTQVVFHADDPLHGLDVDFLKTFQGLYLYLSAHAPFSHSWVDIVIDGQKQRFQGHLQKGNQRLLLPNEAMTLILSALSQESPIEIAISGFHTKIPAGHFPLEKNQVRNILDFVHF